MCKLRRACLALAFLAGAVGHAGSARACGATPCGQLQEVMPRSGTGDVPLNTEVRLLLFGTLEAYADGIDCDLDVTRLRLVPEAGEVVELTGTLRHRGHSELAWLVAKPADPLLPNTSYEAQARLGAGDDVCGCQEREWTTITAFTTGSSVDDTAPAYAGLPALVYGDYAYEAGPCGSINHVPAWPGVDDTLDQPEGTRYNVYVDGRLEKPFVQSLWGSPAVAELLVDCGSSQLHFQSRLSPGKTLEIRAVDLAGNESSPNAPIEVPDVCRLASGTDGGTDGVDGDDIEGSDPALDQSGDLDVAGAVVDPAASSKSSGCALPPGSAAGAPFTSFGVALFLFARRLRRTAASTSKKDR